MGIGAVKCCLINQVLISGMLLSVQGVVFQQVLYQLSSTSQLNVPGCKTSHTLTCQFYLFLRILPYQQRTNTNIVKNTKKYKALYAYVVLHVFLCFPVASMKPLPRCISSWEKMCLVHEDTCKKLRGEMWMGEGREKIRLHEIWLEERQLLTPPTDIICISALHWKHCASPMR